MVRNLPLPLKKSLWRSVVAAIVSLRDRIAPVAKILFAPWFDRLVAAVACVPFALSLRHEFRTFGLDPAWLIANANFVLLIATMLLRRAPKRVTPQPFYWLLAFVATYWLFFTGRYTTAGVSIAPHGLIFALSLASFALSVWARLSLGRSIGLVPADRGVVRSGAYRFMRHPIYTGVYCAYLALCLQNFSAVNVSIFAVGAALFVVKSFVEEDFLRRDPLYESYMAAVPWRWLPFVI
jgi:protein-S-isoprenylcysteine O-methyltransferase Ste14